MPFTQNKFTQLLNNNQWLFGLSQKLDVDVNIDTTQNKTIFLALLKILKQSQN